jgi:hypothetical protein
MAYKASIDNLPRDVEHDLSNGFVLTDIDDRFQRCKKLNETTFTYRSGTDDQGFLCALSLDERESIEYVISEDVDISSLSEQEVEEAVSSYYGSVEELENEYEDSANMIIAECYFEQEIDHLR